MQSTIVDPLPVQLAYEMSSDHQVTLASPHLRQIEEIQLKANTFSLDEKSEEKLKIFNPTTTKSTRSS
jgi:hypothetical protein